MILYLYRNVLINVQCLVLRIKVIYYYTISVLFFLKILRFIGFVPARSKTKSQTSQLLCGKILEVCFSSVPILNGYKVFDSMLVYFLILVFFFLLLFLCFFKQPHAFTSTDKDFFFLYT